MSLGHPLRVVGPDWGTGVMHSPEPNNAMCKDRFDSTNLTLFLNCIRFTELKKGGSVQRRILKVLSNLGCSHFIHTLLKWVCWIDLCSAVQNILASSFGKCSNVELDCRPISGVFESMGKESVSPLIHLSCCLIHLSTICFHWRWYILQKMLAGRFPGIDLQPANYFKWLII